MDAGGAALMADPARVMRWLANQCYEIVKTSSVRLHTQALLIGVDICSRCGRSAQSGNEIILKSAPMLNCDPENWLVPGQIHLRIISLMESKSTSGGLVYSTDSGRMCPGCRHAIANCICTSTTVIPASDGVVRVYRETKGRGGKGVTVVRGLGLGALELAAMGKQLKAACGSGGTVKDGSVEVQGDHCDRVIAFLKAKGLVVKRAGG